jgi:hypothetical protein
MGSSGVPATGREEIPPEFFADEDKIRRMAC